MEKLRSIFEEIVETRSLISGVFSSRRAKDKEDYQRVRIEPVLLKEAYNIQFSYEYGNKVIHENLEGQASVHRLMELGEKQFKNINLFLVEKDLEILISKKGKLKINERKASKKLESLDHNRTKDYILEDGREHDFLVELGIMDQNFKVKPSRYDKFRQINKFLELVEDLVDRLEGQDEINIVDFGCGKSYLSFALYYYLVEIRQLNIKIVGLDLKEDVIKFCNEKAAKLGYGGLRFIHGDIKDFDELDKVDMVVTLHACDIATDAALAKALAWDAKLILSVPCCQSEFYSKIDNPALEPMLKHGLVRERLAALVTDSLRGLALEALGYQVQLVEFIDMENTPKNLLIRAYKDPGKNVAQAQKDYGDFKDFWKLEDIFLDGELEKISKSLA